MLKKIMVLVCIVSLMTIVIGCSSESENDNNAIEENNAVEKEVIEKEVKEVIEEPYTYTYDGVTIEFDSEAKPILDQLDKEISYFESESCAFPGLDKIYTYPGLEIQTYEKDKVDHILNINILDDTLKTNEGIRLFDSRSKVLDVYGDNYEEESGYYIYKKGDTALSFLIKDEEVIAIEYSALVKEVK